MGKKKFIDKKKSVMFRLVPAIDKNNVHRLLLQHVETKNCTLSAEQKKKLIDGLSNEKDFDLKKVEPVDPRFEGIPPQILEKIRGRTDLVINQKGGFGRSHGNEDIDEDYDDDVKIEEVDGDDDDDEDEEQIEGQIAEDEVYRQKIVEEEEDAELGEHDMQDEIQYIDQNEEEEWVDDDDSSNSDDQCDEVELIIESPTKSDDSPLRRPPVFSQADFPSISNQSEDPKLQEQKMSLTDEQLKILNSVIPENYKDMQFKGFTMKKFDDMGLPLDGRGPSKYLAKGGGQIIAAMYSETAPSPTIDIDIAEEQIPEDAKDVEDCLNDGHGYEELEDDFFIQLMNKEGAQVKIKKPTEKKDATKKDSKKDAKKIIQKKVVKRVEQPKQQQVCEVKKPKGTLKKGEEEQEYQDLDDQDITDQQLQRAIKDFDQHKEFSSKVKFDLSRNKQSENVAETLEQAIEEKNKDDVPFYQLSKKDKLKFMRNHKITDPQGVRDEELQQKLNSVGHCIQPDQMHLRKIYEKIPIQKDYAMQNALENDDAGPIEDSESSSDHDDIVSYRTKNSTIFSNLNYVEEEKKKKIKKPKTEEDEESNTLKQKPKPPCVKRQKNETKQEKKQRKEMLKNFKKERKEVKKQFMEQLNQQRKIVSGNTQAPLYGISRITIQ